MAFFGATISAVPDIARSPCWLVARTLIVTWRPSGAFDMTLATIVMTSPGRVGVVVSIVWRTSFEPAPGSRPAMSALISALAQPVWAASLLKARVAATVGSTRPAPSRRRLRREQREILRRQRVDETVFLADLQGVERAVFDRRHGTLS